ncbi:hypothetical protein OH76DRAFT_729576 [Lentinus brumalis]|uniref:Uncharacterized protein n=1 Tax=Lentinus brumalis TaxID=2498619 RepID=A0A371CGX2_9APHY|nr:hypothetical protein OH76DRAFT_729576 [Polyporus brumalis]
MTALQTRTHSSRVVWPCISPSYGLTRHCGAVTSGMLHALPLPACELDTTHPGTRSKYATKPHRLIARNVFTRRCCVSTSRGLRRAREAKMALALFVDDNNLDSRTKVCPRSRASTASSDKLPEEVEDFCLDTVSKPGCP